MSTAEYDIFMDLKTCSCQIVLKNRYKSRQWGQYENAQITVIADLSKFAHKRITGCEFQDIRILGS